MRNYMTVRGSQHIFFDDVKVTDTQEAFDKAMNLAGSDVGVISLYSLPANPGPWDRAGLMGHRRRGDILTDISGEQDPIELENRKAELGRLEAMYFAQGRVSIPMEIVRDAA